MGFWVIVLVTDREVEPQSITQRCRNGYQTIRERFGARRIGVKSGVLEAKKLTHLDCLIGSNSAC